MQEFGFRKWTRRTANEILQELKPVEVVDRQIRMPDYLNIRYSRIHRGKFRNCAQKGAEVKI